MEEGAEGSEAGQAGTSRARLTAATPHLVVAVVSLWLTRSFWFPGRYVVGFDTYAYSGPNVEVTLRALRQGRLPLVNELIFGGVPHLGNPSAAALYPPQLLALVLETNRAMGVVVTAHVVMMGLAMVVLARRLGLAPIGTAAAGILAVAAGSTLTKTIQYEQILVLAWMPVLIIAIHAVLHSARPWRSVAGLAVVTAGILLAGHPQLVYQAAVLAGAATIGFAIGGERWRRLGHLAGGTALGVAMAAPQLVAVLYATADSAVSGGRDIEALRSPALSLPREYMARALLGTVQDRDLAEFASGFESIAFVGVVGAVFVVMGAAALLRSRQQRPWMISFGVTALLALAWSTGPRSALFRFAFEVVPGFDLARASSRWLVVTIFVAALFAGAGVEAVWRGVTRAHASTAAIAILIVTGLLVAGVLVTADRRSAAIWAVTAIVTLALLACGLLAPRWATGSNATRIARGSVVALLVLAAGELGMMSLHSLPQTMRTDTPFTAHQAPTTDFLSESTAGLAVALTDDARGAEYEVPGMRPNANVLHGVPSIDGYDGGVQVTERWADALRRFQAAPPTDLPLRNSLTLPIEPGPLGRLGVRYVLLDRARPPADFIPGWTGPLVTDDRFQVWENPAWIGEAVAWPAAIVTDDPADLLRTDPDAAATAAIVADAADAFDCTGSCEPFAINVRRPRPERIELTVDADREMLVSVAQQALPGWELEVDGQRAEVVEVDGIFLGARLAPGLHSVAFTYRSPLLAFTLLVAALAVVATVGLLIADTVGHRRRTAQVHADPDR
jgi:hypothetical protein